MLSNVLLNKRNLWRCVIACGTLWGVVGRMCKPPYRTITWESGRRLISNREYSDVFYDAMSHLGYDVAGDPGKMFERDEDEARAELLVSGQVDEVALDLCRRYNWWFGEYTGYTGAAIIRVVWSVYDHLQRRVVYQTVTTGFGQEDDTNSDAREIILQRAFTDAAAALGKDDGFRRVVFQPQSRTTAPGTPPESLPAPAPAGAPTQLTVPRPAEPRPDPAYPLGPAAGVRPSALGGAPPPSGEDGLMPGGPRPDAESDRSAPAALPEMAIPRQPKRSGAIGANASALVRATVVIALADSSGSGFFIARDPEGGGWILTNAHVVHDALRVRVSTFDHRARIGTVVRRHLARDVALVHVEGEVPALVSIRETPVAVGDAVFAMGEPLGKAQRNTLSHGIVSRFAKHMRSGLEVIQSDVMIQHGSSGGPLTDAAGNVVGVCAALVPSLVDNSQGLNYFIPIADAFDKLKLVLSGRA